MRSDPKLTIVIPAFNEERRLPSFIAAIVEHLRLQCEIIVVDDGSTDQTSAVAARLLHGRGRVIRVPTNQGKGAAIKLGVAHAKAPIVCITDADGSAALKSFGECLEIIRTKNIHGVIGVRYQKDATYQLSFVRAFLGKLFSFATRSVLSLRYSDTQCGFKMFKTSEINILLRLCQEQRFGIDFELLYLAEVYNIQFEEYPIHWIEKPGSKVHLIKDGLKMLLALLQIRNRHHFNPQIAESLKQNDKISDLQQSA